MKLRKSVAMVVAPLVGVLALAACSPGGSDDEPTNVNLDQDWSKADPITVDVYDGLANYMGIQNGWFGKVVKDKFNMELNIIAPQRRGGAVTPCTTPASRAATWVTSSSSTRASRWTSSWRAASSWTRATTTGR